MRRDEPSPPPTLSEALGFQETVVEVGMTHPGVRRVLSCVGGTIGFVVGLDDERITDLEVEIGFGHRGFEKEVESRGWLRALPYVRRLGFSDALHGEAAFLGGLEALAGWAVAERGRWLRMWALELSRATTHFVRLAAVGDAVECAAAGHRARQGAAISGGMLARLSGREPLAGWLRPGGVVSALPDDFDASWAAGRKQIEEAVAAFETVGTRNPTVVRRLRDVGRITADECAAWSVTGPALRAAGIASDVRRDESYLEYDSVDFDVPIGENGDAYDRVLVVVEEIRQSLRIAEQCGERLGALGPGEIAIDASQAETTVVPEGTVDASVESATGELAFTLVADASSDGVPDSVSARGDLPGDGGRPRRVRCRAPSFFHAQALPVMLRGGHLEDLLPTVASLHVVSTECDR